MNRAATDKSAQSWPLAERVAFLSRPETYPDPPERVEAIETHMAWVFLSAGHAWKLKKPVRTRTLDFSTLEARRRDCELEVELNQRLAPGVYRGVVALTVAASGGLRLGHAGMEPQGLVVDWLVRMWRLPRDLMLDARIAAGRVSAAEVERAAAALARFYAETGPCELTGAEFAAQLRGEVEENRRQLVEGGFEISVAEAAALLDAQCAILDGRREMFDERAAHGRVIDAHGDLRPEHICLEREPVIIDRLEFNRALRLHDCASELTFLALECERLGAPWVGDLFFGAYVSAADDHPPAELLDFYRSWHACTRARLALLHLRDESPRDPAKWVNRARWYLERDGR